MDEVTQQRHEVEARLSAHIEALEFQRSSLVRTRLEASEELEREAAAIGATALAMRARLVRADMLLREGHPPQAAKLAIQVNLWARTEDDPRLLSRSHLVLSSLYESIGDAASGLDHALTALELADETTPPRERGNLILRLADALAGDGSLAHARDRYREAQRLFASIGDVEREITALNSLASTQCLSSDAEQAWRSATEMRDLAERNGFELDPAFADTLARAALGVGRLEEAEQVLEEALAVLERGGPVEPTTPADVLLTLARVLRRRGALDAAQATLDRCRAVCADRELASLAADALAEQAELHAAAGRFDLAYEMHKQYHAQAVGLASARREAAARTRQVVFETDEARRAAERYWQQARTDALSGLPNRRLLDEELARRLAAAAAGEELVVAIVDADHFKRINDTLSHAAGDRAITELSRVLVASLARLGGSEGERSPLVGRLGGEEFLVLLPQCSRDAARGVLEGVRGAVEQHDWSAVAPALRLTVSIGATLAHPDDTASEVLRRADAQLYLAKRAGRDRVALDRTLAGKEPTGSGRGGSGRRRPRPTRGAEAG